MGRWDGVYRIPKKEATLSSSFKTQRFLRPTMSQ